MTTTVTGAIRNSLRNISELRALEPAFDGQQVELLGHTTAGVGGGVFYHDASSAAADDNGVTIVTAGGKRWIRKVDGYVTPEMFGAKGDGSTDDTAAFSSAIGVMNSIKLGKSTYLITDTVATITGNESLSIIGENQIDSVVLFKPSLAETPLIYSATGINFPHISKFKVIGDSALSAGSRKGIFIKCDDEFTRARIDDIELEYLDQGFVFPGNTYSNTFTNVKTNVIRIGWNWPTIWSTYGASCNNNVFERCRFRADDTGIFINSPAIDVHFISCIYDNRIGGASSLSVDIKFCNTVYITGGYNESRDRPTFNFEFPTGRGYLGNVSIKGMYCVNSFTTARNSTAITLSGELNAKIENIYFNGWDVCIDNNMTNGELHLSNYDSAVVNSTVDSAGATNSPAFIDGCDRRVSGEQESWLYPCGRMVQANSVTAASLAISTAYMGGFRTSGQTWTYPVPFVGNVSGSLEQYGSTSFGAAGSFDPLSCTYFWTAVTSQSSASRSIRIFASGRWK